MKRVQFPFGRKGVRLNCNEKGSVKGISEEALEAIERARVQYGEGLSLLCEFSNQDKHRFLMPAYPHLKRFEFVFDQNEGKSELQPVDEDMLLIRDGSRVDFPNGSVIQPRIGFQLERDDVSYGSEHIDGMNEAVRCTLNALIPLTQSSQGVHP